MKFVGTEECRALYNRELRHEWIIIRFAIRCVHVTMSGFNYSLLTSEVRSRPAIWLESLLCMQPEWFARLFHSEITHIGNEFIHFVHPLYTMYIWNKKVSFSNSGGVVQYFAFSFNTVLWKLKPMRKKLGMKLPNTSLWRSRRNLHIPLQNTVSFRSIFVNILYS